MPPKGVPDGRSYEDEPQLGSEATSAQGTHDPRGLAGAHGAGPGQGNRDGRQTPAGSPESTPGRAGGNVPAGARDHIGRVLGAGIPGQDAEHLIDALRVAFESGDPERAYISSMNLVKAHRSLVVESARLRFKVNFGGPICDSCDGLRAGPGVLATCFQVRQCNYASLKEDSLGDRMRAIVDALDGEALKDS